MWCGSSTTLCSTWWPSGAETISTVPYCSDNNDDDEDDEDDHSDDDEDDDSDADEDDDSDDDEDHDDAAAGVASKLHCLLS